MRHPPSGSWVYYPDSRHPRYQAGRDVPFQPPRPPARRKPGAPIAIIWPGIPLGALAIIIISTAMDSARKTAPAPARPPKVVTHTITRTITRTVTAHPMPAWEAIGLVLIIGFVVLCVVSLLVHAYRSRQ